jgi:hypothetical protein
MVKTQGPQLLLINIAGPVSEGTQAWACSSGTPTKNPYKGLIKIHH